MHGLTDSVVLNNRIICVCFCVENPNIIPLV